MTTSTPQRASSPDVVVVVVSWNTRELLDRCLRSLRADAERGIASVWVVDNASTDGSPDLVRERHPWVTLVASEENLGYGPAVNHVAERTSSRWLVASNSDIELRDGALRRLLDSGESDPGAGVVAPRLILPDGSTQHSVWAFPTLPFAAIQATAAYRSVPGLADRLALPGHWDVERRRRVPWAIGAFLLVRRAAWDEVGGFDSGQWMSAEDLDLGWRMRAAGWATRYEPLAEIEHAESAATTQVWGRQLHLHWQRCAYAWMLRRRGRIPTAAVGLVNFAGSAARYAAYTALAHARAPEPWLARREGLGRWTLGHRYALAPRRVLDRYR